MPADKKGNIKNVELDIKGSASNDIPNSLYDAGLIKSKISFKVYVRYHHFYDKLKAGKYDFNTGMSTAQIVDKMVKGQVKDDTVKVVIPEGYTVKKVADVLQDAGLFSAQEFLDAAQNT
ncbi:MAG TPA: aminodeoxychorismate lyase, partial [Clostridiaceae bacterium]|nr:aminodeoxychorismate lyase [Clostridiaceae bacterium]